MSSLLLHHHTIGVRPEGEAFLSAGGHREAQRRRISGLGVLLAGIDDVLIQHVVEHLAAQDLLQLATISHWGHAWGSIPALWKRLTLLKASDPVHSGRLLHVTTPTSSSPFAPSLEMIGQRGADGWKRCYRLLRAKEGGALRGDGAAPSERQRLASAADDTRTREAVQVRGVFSDLLFHSHICASTAALPSRWLERDNAPRRRVVRSHEGRGKTFTVEQFVREFEVPNRPVVLQGCDVIAHYNESSANASNVDAGDGCADSGPEHEALLDRLVTRYGASLDVHVAGYTMRLREYVAYARSTALFDDAPLYLFDKHFMDKVKAAEERATPESGVVPETGHRVSDAGRGGVRQESGASTAEQRRASQQTPTDTSEHFKYSVPPYFQDDLFSLLERPSRLESSAAFSASSSPLQSTSLAPRLRRPDWRWIIAGPARSGSSFHIDPNGTSAWNACLSGQKKWILFPPDRLPPGVYAASDQSEVATPPTPLEWFLNFYDEARREDQDFVLSTNAAPEGATAAAPSGNSDSNRDHLFIECVVGPGDVLFVPRGWWHCVLNLTESVAVTQNFVSATNLPHVLNYLDTQPQNISGLDSDEERAALPQAFREALRVHRPDLLKHAEQARLDEELEKKRKQKRQMRANRWQQPQQREKDSRCQDGHLAPPPVVEIARGSFKRENKGGIEPFSFSFGFGT